MLKTAMRNLCNEACDCPWVLLQPWNLRHVYIVVQWFCVCLCVIGSWQNTVVSRLEHTRAITHMQEKKTKLTFSESLKRELWYFREYIFPPPLSNQAAFCWSTWTNWTPLPNLHGKINLRSHRFLLKWLDFASEHNIKWLNSEHFWMKFSGYQHRQNL